MCAKTSLNILNLKYLSLNILMEQVNGSIINVIFWQNIMIVLLIGTLYYWLSDRSEFCHL